MPISKNDWVELITVSVGSKSVGTSTVVRGGWRWGCDDSTVTIPPYGADNVVTDSAYVDDKYGSENIDLPSLPRGSLVVLYDYERFDPVGPLDIDDAIIEGGLFLPSVGGNNRLVFGFHDEANWADNSGSCRVTISIDGSLPIVIDVSARCCVYFAFADSDLVGPYYEVVDDCRPVSVDVTGLHGMAYISVESSPIETVTVPNTYTYLDIQRYMFDKSSRSGSETLSVSTMLWSKCLDPSDFSLYLLSGNELTSIQSSYSVIRDRPGPIVVAIHNDVDAPQSAIISAINKSNIMPNRTWP